MDVLSLRALDRARPGILVGTLLSWNSTDSSKTEIDPTDIKGIGIAYQMHGLVTIDQGGSTVRNAIIWCDSRAVEIGEEAYQKIGTAFCDRNFLNSPGNFTAAKLAWVKQNEPERYAKIHKIMLPGDFLAYRFSGECTTTVTLCRKGFWNFPRIH